MVLIKNKGSEEARLSWDSYSYVVSPGQEVDMGAAAAAAFLRRNPNVEIVSRETIVPNEEVKKEADKIIDPIFTPTFTAGEPQQVVENKPRKGRPRKVVA